MLRFEAAITGNLNEVLAQEEERAAAAITAGTHQAGDALKARLRAQVIAAFGSQRLANTWRGVAFPGKGKTSLGPTDLVYSKAPHIIETFSAATTIRSKKGFFLAIPSPDCPKEYAYRRVTPSNWNDARYGKLRFVYRPGKASLLVVDAVSRNASGKVGRRLANDGLTKSGGFKRGYSSVVMFFLVPFARFKQRFDLEAEYERAGNEMLTNIISAWRDA